MVRNVTVRAERRDGRIDSGLKRAKEGRVTSAELCENGPSRAREGCLSTRDFRWLVLQYLVDRFRAKVTAHLFSVELC